MPRIEIPGVEPVEWVDPDGRDWEFSGDPPIDVVSRYTTNRTADDWSGWLADVMTDASRKRYRRATKDGHLWGPKTMALVGTELMRAWHPHLFDETTDNDSGEGSDGGESGVGKSSG
jgi:hypothetical protein